MFSVQNAVGQIGALLGADHTGNDGAGCIRPLYEGTRCQVAALREAAGVTLALRAITGCYKHLYRSRPLRTPNSTSTLLANAILMRQ
jgi:hypothetical protein